MEIAALRGRGRMRRLAGCVLLVCCVACAPRASVEPEPPEPPESAAGAVVREFHAVVVAVMKEADALGYEGRRGRLRDAVREAYDIPFMARATLGSQWSQLSPAQQADWVQLFERFHVSALADSGPRYAGQSFEPRGEKPAGSGTVRVRTDFVDPHRNVHIGQDYRLRAREGRWRIIDSFSPRYVSELEMRRAEYAVVLEAGGYEALVRELQRRIGHRSEQGPAPVEKPR